MTDVSKPPSGSRWPRFRWRFTLRGLMAFTFGVAVGLARYADARTNWAFWKFDWGPNSGEERLLAATSAWIMLGLLAQAWDMRHAYVQKEDLTTEARFGWQFAVFWRVGLAMVLLSTFVVDQLREHDAALFQSLDGQIWFVDTNARESLRLLCLICVLFSVQCWRDTNAVSSVWSRCLEIVGVLAVLAIGMMYLASTFTLQYLMHANILAAMIGLPGDPGTQPVGRAYVENLVVFSRWTVLASCIVLVSFYAAVQIARHWTASIGRRLLWTAMLVAGLVSSLVYDVWVYAIGLSTISPFIAQTLPLGFPVRWLLALTLLCVFTTGLSYRLIVVHGKAFLSVGEHWRDDDHRYLHEQTPVIFLLLVALLIGKIRYSIIARSFGDKILDYLYDLLNWPQPALQVIGIYLAVRMLYQCWFLREGPQRDSPPGLRPRQFTMAWLSLFLTTALAAVAWAHLGFCAWLCNFWSLPF